MSSEAEILSLNRHSQVASGAYHDEPVDVAAQASRADIFTLSMMGPADGEHYDPSNQDLRIQSGYKVAPISITSWVDELPSGRTQSNYLGEKVKILFGLNSTYQTRFELHFKLSISYASGRVPDAIRFAPWLGERLVGKDYTVKFQNEPIRRMNMDGLHFRRRLEEDFFSSKAAGYQHGAAAVSIGIPAPGASSSEHVWCELDMGYSDAKPLVSVAQAHEHELSFQLPTKEEIIQATDASGELAQADIDGLTVEVTDVFLRCHTVECDQIHRFKAADYILKQGVKYHVSEIEVNPTEVTAGENDSAFDTVQTIEADLSLIQPSAYLFFVLRYEGDLGEAEALDPTDEAPLVGGAFTTEKHSKPDRYNSLPLVSWSLREGNTLLWPETSWKYYSTALHPRLFNSEIHQPIGVVPFTQRPTLAADHSLGHLSLTNANRPKLVVKYVKGIDVAASGNVAGSLQARYDTVALATTHNTAEIPVRLTVFSCNYNFLYKKNGRIFLGYN